jgi:hypothetical protein
MSDSGLGPGQLLDSRLCGKGPECGVKFSCSMNGSRHSHAREAYLPNFRFIRCKCNALTKSRKVSAQTFNPLRIERALGNLFSPSIEITFSKVFQIRCITHGPNVPAAT